MIYLNLIINERNVVMKIKNGFVKRNIAGTNIVVATGKKAPFHGTIHLNDSASFFWDCFQKDISVDECVRLVCENYDVEEKRARADVEKFVKMLKDNDLVE